VVSQARSGKAESEKISSTLQPMSSCDVEGDMSNPRLRQIIAVLFTIVTAHAAPVQYTVAVHSEEPSVPDTPNFSSLGTPKATYLHWRNAILAFAELADEYDIKWSFQSDWNFLEGIRRFEVAGRPGFDPTLLLTATDGTSGLNLLQYLAHEYGVELDPHSHENGVNYADVDWLIRVGLGAPSSGVVGGHINDPTDTSNYQDWPKFLADPRGLEASQHAGHFWRPTLLMGGGTAGHENEYHVSGIWRPADEDHFYTHAPDPAAQPLVSCGQWFNDLHEHLKLIRRVNTGALPGGNRLYTCGIVLNHRDMANDANYTETKARAVLATVKAWQDAGLIENRHFEELIPLWQSAPYSSTPNIHLLPDDMVQFSLNWQDYSRPDLSADRLRRILDAHEAAAVPLDVFFTTWQTDVIEAQDPGLLGRLQSSSMAVMSYHVRPPKPYANNFLNGPLAGTSLTTEQRTALITQYESRELQLTNGQPHPTKSGGYDKLKTLMDYAPLTVGVQPDAVSYSPTLTNIARGVFKSMGAGFLVNHNGFTQLGARTSSSGGSMYFRPETLDWRLIALWTHNPDDPQPETLDEALATARATSGARRPFFTGIKTHDNDLFHEQSWWSLVYPHSSRNAGSWNPLQTPAALSQSEQDSRLEFYLNLVEEVASRASTVNAVNSRDFWPMLENVVPARPIGLSHTSGDECGAGTVLAEISGGGVDHGTHCTYTLISGSGGDHNADFSISGHTLIASRPLDFEAESHRHLRLRWADASGSSGERALTFIVRNQTNDDDDGDGSTEADESAAGTDPADAQSVFRVLSIGNAPDGAVILSFPSVAGKLYRLFSSPDLEHWTEETDASASVTGNGSILSVRDPFPALGKCFYKLAVSTP
jgi:hypothetical protein